MKQYRRGIRRGNLLWRGKSEAVQISMRGLHPGMSESIKGLVTL